jgi:hypothetical protein
LIASGAEAREAIATKATALIPHVERLIQAAKDAVVG